MYMLSGSYLPDTLFVFVDRYMRNDLTRLQIRCVNAGQGCEAVCSLESLHTHEDECEFAFVSCSNTGKKPPTKGVTFLIFSLFYFCLESVYNLSAVIMMTSCKSQQSFS